MSVELLRSTSLFASLDDEHLERLAARSRVIQLAPGELLVEEGSQGDGLFVIISGELEVSKRSSGVEVPVARVGAGALQGEMAALEGGVRTASVRAVEPVEALCIPREALRELLASGPEPALAIIRTVIARLRGTEAMLRQREKLAGLGTLAAGLAHELNNPAAAIRRSASSLAQALEAGQRARAAVDSLGISAERLREIRQMAPASAPGGLSPLERADRADVIGSILEELPLEDPHGAAATLVDAGWQPETLRTALAGFDRGQGAAVIDWLATTHSVDELLGEVKVAADRISEIVGAVKEYAYLDQAPVQRVDVRVGLDNTLVILRHKLKAGIEVERAYADDLPQIEAYGGELNQVWTNLVDNAVDAMQGRGKLRIAAERQGDGVRITICDNGPGIPPEIRSRLFEPFFTTKPVGHGTGLGLHIAYSVVARHRGGIEVDSEPGRTCFRVSLPASLGRPRTDSDPEPAEAMG